jgi:hypothetical protein
MNSAGAEHEWTVTLTLDGSPIRIRRLEPEVSVLLAHEQHDRGVGTTLLRTLGIIAHANGIHHLVADVLAENQSVSKVVTDADWPCIRHRDGCVVHFDVDLDEVREA